MADVNLTVSADLAKLRAQLEQIGPITKDQAASMVKELERAYVRAEVAAKKTAETTRKAMADTTAATKRAVDANKELEDRFGKVGSSAGKVAGVLDLLAPGLGDAARGIADVADGMEVAAQGGSTLALGLGVVGAAMGAVAMATAHYEAELAKVEERNRKVAESASAAVASAQRLKDTEAELAIELAAANGQLSEQEVATMRSTAAVRDAFAEQERAARQRLADAKAARDNTQATYDEVQAATAAVDAIVERKNNAIAAAAEIVAAKEREKRAEQSAEAATRAKAQADRAAAEALRVRSEAYKESLALMEEESRAQEQARSITDALTASTAARTRAALEGADAVTAAMEHELAQTLARYQEGTRAAGANNAAQLDLTRAYEAEVESIRQDAHAKRLALIDAEKKAQEEADAAALEVQRAAIMEGIALVSDSLAASADNQAQILEQLTSQLESNAENMTEADKRALKERIAAQRDAAMVAFGVNKAAQLATATVNTATAITAALASAPPPANLIAAGVAGAAGAVQVAAIASQQPAFHSGGMVPDEVPARLVTGEAVLSRVGRNVIGDEQIRAANAGIAPPVKVVAINQYRHEVFRPFIRDHLRLGGDLSSAIRGTRTVGQREAL